LKWWYERVQKVASWQLMGHEMDVEYIQSELLPSKRPSLKLVLLLFFFFFLDVGGCVGSSCPQRLIAKGQLPQ